MHSFGAPMQECQSILGFLAARDDVGLVAVMTTRTRVQIICTQLGQITTSMPRRKFFTG